MKYRSWHQNERCRPYWKNDMLCSLQLWRTSLMATISVAAVTYTHTCTVHTYSGIHTNIQYTFYWSSSTVQSLHNRPGQPEHKFLKLEAIQRWSAICRMWPWTLTYQKFLLCVASQGQDLYSHQKLNMYIYWFSSESSYRRRRRRRQQCQTAQYNH